MTETAALLREVCVAMLVYGEPDPELAGWCLRMLAESSAAERSVISVTKVIENRAPQL